MSDTPRTDDCEGSASDHPDCMALTEHARQLERELAKAQAEIVRLKGEAESWEKVFDRTCEHLAKAKTELAEAQRNYMELIMSVKNAYPNETRHQTALHYIRERENTPSHGPDSAAIKEMK